MRAPPKPARRTQTAPCARSCVPPPLRCLLPAASHTFDVCFLLIRVSCKRMPGIRTEHKGFINTQHKYTAKGRGVSKRAVHALGGTRESVCAAAVQKEDRAERAGASPCQLFTSQQSMQRVMVCQPSRTAQTSSSAAPAAAASAVAAALASAGRCAPLIARLPPGGPWTSGPSKNWERKSAGVSNLGRLRVRVCVRTLCVPCARGGFALWGEGR